MNIPFEIRLGALFLVGVVIGGQLNRGIYRLAWEPRNISPWSPTPSAAGPRHWWDRVPIIGWCLLRRETPCHGRGFWIRPLLIEIGTGLGFAALYWLEVDQLVAWPTTTLRLVPDWHVVHCQYLAHVLLISLMIVATFIDFDDQTIPDEITVPGTILGLLLAVAFPRIALPTLFEPALGPATVQHVVVTSSTTSPIWLEGLGGPFSWPPQLSGFLGLSLALAGIWIWCFAILHKTWTLRHGVWRALQYLTASVVRRRSWRIPLAAGVVLSLLVMVVWAQGTERWQSLFSAIAGLCFGGGLIWAVRIVGGQALRTEAMGFGDVTLMAMIGAFLGWQPTFLVFFMAPFSALVIALAQWALTGDRHIAFGPYLCLSAVIVLLAWDAIWAHWAMPMFSFGWFIPALLACCLVLMGGLLWVWRILKEAIFGL